MIAADQQRFRDAVAASKARASSFIASIPQDLAKREDLIAEEALRENSSAKSKLGKLYRLVEELGEAAKPFIACGKGCSVVDVNYPDRSATTILAGGSGG